MPRIRVRWCYETILGLASGDAMARESGHNHIVSHITSRQGNRGSRMEDIEISLVQVLFRGNVFVELDSGLYIYSS